MHGDAATLRRLDIVIWAIVAAVALTVSVACIVSDFRLVWSSFLAPAGAGVVLLAGQALYSTWRRDPVLASALGCTAQVVAFSAVAAPLSYVGASFGLPLQDGAFHAIDRALQLNWAGWLTWMNAHPALHPVFREIYQSLMPQALAVVLVLAYTGRLAWLRVFLLAFFFAALVTIAIAAVLPAEGVWGFYGIRPEQHGAIMPSTRETHLAIFHGLRDGSFRLLMARGAEGIITFPSLHAALGVILAAGFWPLRYLRWIGVGLNVIMLASIPIDGGHYFIDIFAGLAIAALALIWASALAAPRTWPLVEPVAGLESPAKPVMSAD
jgi:membrane-associated phospholipid phosphatase